MQTLRFCPHCGGLLERGFLFCPYCGIELLVKPSVSQIIDPPFAKIECIITNTSLRRLESCRATLDTIEKELDDFLKK
jgi:DNA-directed RNA polymerase subunit RPC12/RpoP